MLIVTDKKATDDGNTACGGELAGARNASKKKGENYGYKRLNGRAFLSYAFTPRAVKSDLAHLYGIRITSDVPFDQGCAVRLRMKMNQPSKEIRCKAVIDQVTKDKSSGAYIIALSRLSLTNEEFELVLNNCIEEDEQKSSINKWYIT